VTSRGVAKEYLQHMEKEMNVSKSGVIDGSSLTEQSSAIYLFRNKYVNE
jgi:hypothetical protein